MSLSAYNDSLSLDSMHGFHVKVCTVAQTVLLLDEVAGSRAPVMCAMLGCRRNCYSVVILHPGYFGPEQVHSLCVESRPGDRLRLAKGPSIILSSAV